MVLTLGAGLGWRFQGLVPWVGVPERLGLARVLGCSTHMWGIVRVDGLCMWRLRDPPSQPSEKWEVPISQGRVWILCGIRSAIFYGSSSDSPPDSREGDTDPVPSGRNRKNSSLLNSRKEVQ